VGLALGAWGAIQATAAGVGVAISGVLRDLIHFLTPDSGLPAGLSGAARGYTGVYLLEILLLVATLLIMLPLVRQRLGGTASAAATR
jgi:MFS transporter, BCD family, chlorophyll transporter